MLKLFSKEKALYLVDNPTKVGFSWWYLFAGIAAAYAMYRRYGDSYFVIVVAEKYVFISFSLFFGLSGKWVKNRVMAGMISRSSALLYVIPIFGCVFTFFCVIKDLSLLSVFVITKFKNSV